MESETHIGLTVPGSASQPLKNYKGNKVSSLASVFVWRAQAVPARGWLEKKTQDSTERSHSPQHQLR